MTGRLRGRICSWNRERGWGYLRNEGGENEFVHITDVRSQVIPTIGDYVSYSIGKSAQGRRRAVDVVIDGAETAGDVFADH